MAGNILLKESAAAVTITSTGASLTNGSAALAGAIDCRSGGTANIVEQLQALFFLIAQWGTVGAIAAGTTVAELYLVPSYDGTNFPDVDLTAGASYIPLQTKLGLFQASKAPTAVTNMTFVSNVVDLMPVKYNVYILNKSGQTITANWTLDVLGAAAQYT